MSLDIALEGAEAPAQLVCTSPCAAMVPIGRYQAMVGPQGEEPRAVKTDVFVRGNTLVRLAYSDRSGLRLAGWITLGASLLVGGGLIGAAVAIGAANQGGCGPNGCVSAAINPASILLGAGGALIAIGGTVVGLVLGTRRDRPDIEVFEAR
jgi:energy-converting hydrogenase Eha subunit E